MSKKQVFPCCAALLFLVALAGCQSEADAPTPGLKAFVGARLIDGTGHDPVENSVIIVRDGRIEAAGSADSVPVPDDAERIDLAGKTVIPGMFNGHGHVGSTRGLEGGPEVYTRENILDQLALNARYGVTTVISLGNDAEAGIQVRDVQNSPELSRARLYVAGPVVTAATPEEARQVVQSVAAMKVDWIKIRVDDNLGASRKMTPEVYQAVIDEAHQHGLPVAAHLYYLEDAKGLLRAGVDFIAHSVRDQEVDDELIGLLKERQVCVCPTLAREVSTFVYETRPQFFDDPFFLKEADPEVLKQLETPEYQKSIQESKSAQQYKKALEVASLNVKKLADNGIGIVSGTDSGPPARFQGYFEHMELELMARAGLTPMQIISSATSQAADCLKLGDEQGSIQPGRWADMIVLNQDPLLDIRNTRSIDSVWVAGNRVPSGSEAGAEAAGHDEH